MSEETISINDVEMKDLSDHENNSKSIENGENGSTMNGSQGKSDHSKEKQALRQKQNEDLKVQNEKVESEKDETMKERFNFLLQQTDIFKHFIGDHGSSNGNGRRSKKAEEAEDSNLVKQAMESKEPVRLTQSPNYITGGNLRDYQIHGLNWLINLHDHGVSGILADEMGLGKTLQTISLLGYLKNIRNIGGPHLIIVPKSTLANWHKECKKWCPSLSVFVFHGSKEERVEQRNHLLEGKKFDVLITTYEMAIIEKSVLKKFSWRYLIIDEAHRIKNENSILSKVVRIYKSNYRLLITGTPLQNNLHELWALLNFLLPQVFSSSDDFDAWFSNDKVMEEKGDEIREKLHKVLKPFLLRRLKVEVEKSLPPKTETKLYIGLSDMQRNWYKSILQKNIDVINGPGKESRVRLLNILMQLRKCCNHPYLFEGAEPGPPYTTGEHLIENSGKMVLLDLLLGRLKELGSRVLIFSQMTRLLDILEDYMFFKKYDYCRIDGSTSSEDREESIERFNEPDSSVFAFLLSTRAGGLGINLATADTVILFDSDWNPQVDLQAQDRAHRIGQKKPVKVYRFVTQDTVEEQIIDRAEKKLYLDALVIQQGRLAETHKSLSKNELKGMITFGADTIFKSSAPSELTKADIDVILRQGKEKTEESNSKIEKQANSLLNFSSDKGTELKVHEFMGIDYSEQATLNIPKEEPEILTQREKRKNYTEDEYYGNIFGYRQRRSKKKDTLIKPPKQPSVFDFQFYPKKLKPILDKEMDIWKKQCSKLENELTKRREKSDERRKKKETLRIKELELAEKEGREPKPFSDDEDESEDEEEIKNNIIDSIKGLSAKQIKDKEKLSEQGFSQWTKKDFIAFTRGCEYYGRDSFDDISVEIKTKTPDEVKEYSKIFWKKYKEISGWEKIVGNIERGEKRINRLNTMIQTLEDKVTSYKDPHKQLTIEYPKQKRGPSFEPEEDRFMLVATNEVGYGNWELVKHAIRDNVDFRYNWFLKSCNAADIAKRVDTLINLIEKENSKKSTSKKLTGKKRKSPAVPRKQKPAKKRKTK